MKECRDKHTKYQPSDDEWYCPKCGGDAGVFFIDYSNSDNYDCLLIHENDGFVCTKCDKTWSGKQISKMMEKKSKNSTITIVITCEKDKSADVQSAIKHLVDDLKATAKFV